MDFFIVKYGQKNNIMVIFHIVITIYTYILHVLTKKRKREVNYEKCKRYIYPSRGTKY